VFGKAPAADDEDESASLARLSASSAPRIASSDPPPIAIDRAYASASRFDSRCLASVASRRRSDALARPPARFNDILCIVRKCDVRDATRTSSVARSERSAFTTSRATSSVDGRPARRALRSFASRRAVLSCLNIDSDIRSILK
jgi:hypothetical protein